MIDKKKIMINELKIILELYLNKKLNVEIKENIEYKKKKISIKSIFQENEKKYKIKIIYEEELLKYILKEIIEEKDIRKKEINNFAKEITEIITYNYLLDIKSNFKKYKMNKKVKKEKREKNIKEFTKLEIKIEEKTFFVLINKEMDVS